MIDNTAPYIRKGDIVVLAPEYLFFYGRMMYGEEELLRTVLEVSLEKKPQLSFDQFQNMASYLLKYGLSKCKPSEYFNFQKDLYYGVNSFNKYGDANAHWGEKGKDFPPYIIHGDYNSDLIDLMNNFRNQTEKKGARLFISFPGYQKASYEINKRQVKRVHSELRKSKFTLLGTPEKYLMEGEMLFDSPYHLTKDGADRRTRRLIKDIQPYLSN